MLGQHLADHVAADVRAADESSRAPVDDYSIFNRGQAQQALVLALARAHRWSRMLERGEVASISDLARRLEVDSSYIGHILRLTTLAPDIIEAILQGRESKGLSLTKQTKILLEDWAEQHQVFEFTNC